MNRTTGALTAAGVHELGTSPSCLAANASGTRLYSTNETDRVGKDKEVARGRSWRIGNFWRRENDRMAVLKTCIESFNGLTRSRGSSRRWRVRTSAVSSRQSFMPVVLPTTGSSLIDGENGEPVEFLERCEVL